MDLRLSLPILLLVAAVSLAAGVDSALRNESPGFHLQPAGPAAGGWTAITMMGRFGGSPELNWQAVPPGTASLALVARDDSAIGRGRIFWAVWNITPDRRGLPPGLPREARVAGLSQARVGDGLPGFAAPPLEMGGGRRLRFTLYALDRPVSLEPGADADRMEGELRGHVLGTAHWIVGSGW
ncbi:MAG: YbhB/YbcL family Raf kinase inhibitor-like protein [Acidobacteriota bacterium]|nr:YbhB/YbcL family Raf kinase inhibitor-like protein [Acidobacteriota bacterium]MDQ7086692.1 YbhB/YbcL family Raf kinase inhibitor-like protein [Acidobacteriota bacterium]